MLLNHKFKYALLSEHRTKASIRKRWFWMNLTL